MLIVDDSSVIRTLLTALLSADPGIEVVGTARDPVAAEEKVRALDPDVVTLDLEMPRMDGLAYLRRLMKRDPRRVLVISSLTAASSELALQALASGAIDVMDKPALDVSEGLQNMREELVARVKAVASSQLPGAARTSAPEKPATPPATEALDRTTDQVVAIVSSTGGTEALKAVLSDLPPDFPGIAIVQHMPPVFTRTYAESLTKCCALDVREARAGDRLIPGTVLIAPGNFHMELRRSGAQYVVTLHQQPRLHGVRPSGDLLLGSVAKYAGRNAIGVVLTGMGRDGADGLLQMRRAGALTIAQDEATSVVFGMPREAIRLGGAETVLPLDRIGPELLRKMHFRQAA